jgi:cobalt-zinc-cadmium resistance protein CzcA
LLFIDSKDDTIVIKQFNHPLFIVTEEALKDIHFAYLESVTNIYESQIKLQKQHWLPDF